jgi:TPP-dependent pyruvate/acetoin dehydrogenase alpha subunit
MLTFTVGREVCGMDPWQLYELMKRSRLFEEAIARLWEDGLISGEMHLGTGEEAIIAGLVSHLRPGDAMAVDHRGTAAFLMRGVEPVSLVREMLGRTDGLCAGQGGHMHLFSKQHLAASSGIVGAEGPAAVGFALAAARLRPGSVVVAFFGDGAVNQGMLLESFNLAAVWRLPVVFVCKDDGWAITTRPRASTAGRLRDRVRGLGVRYVRVDGRDVTRVWSVAERAIERARRGKGPTFIHARCVHLEGHFLGLLLLRAIRDPLKELPLIVRPLVRSCARAGGGSARERGSGVACVTRSLLDTVVDRRRRRANDPIVRARRVLHRAEGGSKRLSDLERRLETEVDAVVAAALRDDPPATAEASP